MRYWLELTFTDYNQDPTGKLVRVKSVQSIQRASAQAPFDAIWITGTGDTIAEAYALAKIGDFQLTVHSEE